MGATCRLARVSPVGHFPPKLAKFHTFGTIWFPRGPPRKNAFHGETLANAGRFPVCTLVALHRSVPGLPLVIAANRDEFFDRPSDGPALRPTPYGTVLAPKDLREGGTWLGLNKHGVFAALTNRRCEDPDRNRRSRGLLVMDALVAASAKEAVIGIESLIKEKNGAYNPFNLLIADGHQAFAISYADRPQTIELAPGAHVIGNVGFDEPSDKLDRLRGLVDRARRSEPDRILDSLAQVCRDHDGESVDAACVHTAEYGTRSSILFQLHENGLGRDSASELRYAKGAPCREPFLDFTPLLREMDRKARIVEGESIVRSVR